MDPFSSGSLISRNLKTKGRDWLSSYSLLSSRYSLRNYGCVPLPATRETRKRDARPPSGFHLGPIPWFPRCGTSLAVEVGNGIWSVKANERCAGVLRHDGSPNTSQYAVSRGWGGGNRGKLVSMHQIAANRKAYGLVAYHGYNVTRRCPNSFSWSGSCHTPLPTPDYQPPPDGPVTDHTALATCYTGHAPP